MLKANLFDPMTFDLIAFDPMSFDLIAFDLMSFDLIAFNPMSFDHMSVIFLKMGIIIYIYKIDTAIVHVQNAWN